MDSNLRPLAVGLAAGALATPLLAVQCPVPEDESLAAQSPTATSSYGSAVDVGADWVVVGARGDGPTGGGALDIFRRVPGQPLQHEIELTGSDTSAGDFFGAAVAVDGDTVVVGAPFVGIGSGQAYVFHHDGLAWSEQQILVASDADSLDQFGGSVDIDGDVLVVGAAFENGSEGSAYVFRRTGTTWVEEQKLVGDGGEAELFGGSVSISGDRIAAGAVFDSHFMPTAGAVFAFARIGPTWFQEQKISHGGLASQVAFGASVSLEGEQLVIGSPGHGAPSGEFGAAYLYEWKPFTSWGEVALLESCDGFHLDRFGQSVSISNGVIVVGAIRDDDGGFDSGGAVMFLKDGDVWRDSYKLTPQGLAAGDDFGRSVANDGLYTVVGAPNTDGAGDTSGAAHVFQPSMPSVFATIAFRNGSGINPTVYVPDGRPIVGCTWKAKVLPDAGDVATFIAIGMAGPDPGSPSPFGAGELLIGIVPFPELTPASLSFHSIPIPCSPTAVGLVVPTQGGRVSIPAGGGIAIELTNALDLTLGY